MICDDCQNNVDNKYCKVCILADGTNKPISKKQVDCGYYNKETGYNDQYIEYEKTKLEELEERIQILEEKSLSVK